MKSYNQKLIDQFESINISALQEPKRQYHLYADFVELVCIVNSGHVSRSDIIDRLTDEGVRFSPDDETLDGEIGLRDSEISDAQERWINVIFDLLQERSVCFGVNYPFIINDIGIILLEAEKTDLQLVYVYLLISSSLKYFPLVQDILTSEFEILCGNALKNFLPSKAIVKQFGKNSAFKGGALAKIQILADELNIQTNEHYLKQISPSSSQEEGLDIVGWIPFEDKNPNTLIILGQCACGKNWISKQHETKRYENFYEFYKHPPVHTLFLPYALSNQEGKFFQDKDIANQFLIFERRRLLEYSFNFEFNGSLFSKKIVELFLEYKEDIV
jgi:hypothetical protein